MLFKYLNLRKTREITTITSNNTFYPGRRKFVKAMGLSALAWNPVVDSLKLMSSGQLQVKVKNNLLKIYRNNRLGWEISENYFESGYSLKIIQTGDSFSIQATGLKVKQTDLRFSLKAEIRDANSRSECHFSIPEWNFYWSGNFTNWLDGLEIMKGKIQLNQQVASTGNKESIQARGTFSFSLTPDWKFSFSSSNNVLYTQQNRQFQTGNLTIEPYCTVSPPILTSIAGRCTVISLPGFANWKTFLEKIQLEEGRLTTSAKENPDLVIAIPQPKTGKNEKMFWLRHENAELRYKADKISDAEIHFQHFFYYAEYLNNQPPLTYFSASLPETSQWMKNALGSFQIEKDNKIPDFEAFGVDNRFREIIFEPRLRAYNPRIENTITLNSFFQEPEKVRVIQPQKKEVKSSTLKRITPTKSSQRQESTRQTNSETPQNPVKNLNIQINPQRTDRKVQKDQPKIEVQFDRLKFRPKKALTIKILRPEDMVLLEFVFHNFNFTNKGQSPYLELDKEKEAGVVEIYFQSQHTLEEAYFESTPIPDPDPLKPKDNGVKLPAKHLRARKSRLVYELPAGHEGFPLIMSELLDWSKFKLRVHPRAWIKIPSLKRVEKPSRIMLDKKAPVKRNNNLRYLETPTTEYGIKLAQNTRNKASNLEVYQQAEVTKVLTPVTANSVMAKFNLDALKKISLKVGPIPDLSTSIEAPALMYISPNQTNDFYHKIAPEFRDVEELQIAKQVLNTQMRILDPLTTNKGEITELWHTRLGVKLKNGKISGTALPHLKTIRALWADDADTNYKVDKERNYPFMASLDANNRQKLVHTTSNYEIGFEPFPVPVNDLMLTTLGAYLDWHAYFDVPTPQDTWLNIIEWQHIATLGRDHYVKVVEEGYLFPFGHRAAVVKITERKFDGQTKSAPNRQRMYVVVLEKEMLYSRNDPEGHFIEFPFQAVRIKTNATPNIDDPKNSTLVKVTGKAKNGANTTYNFYINVGGKGFPFDIVATDKEGKEHPFRLPLAFMENRIARDASLMQEVIQVYRGKQANDFNKAYNEADFYGHEVAYAEYLVDGDTDFETDRMKFDAQIYPVKGEGELKFHPKIKEAKVFVKQINELTGIREPATITLEDDNNKGSVFARVISDNVVDFSGGSDKSGGFMLPNISVSGLSKLQGPVSGELNNLKELKFIPDDFFKEFNDLPVAKIFGVIEIFKLLLGSAKQPLNLSGSFDGMINAVQRIQGEIEDLRNEILYLENLAKEKQQNVQAQIDQLKQTIKDKVNELLTALNNSVPRIPNLKAFVTEEAFYAEYKWQPKLGGTQMEVIPKLLNVNVTNPNNALTISTKFEKPFDTTKTASMNGSARFEKFEVDVVPLLAVKFNYLEFKTGSSQKTDVKVDIDKNDPIAFKGVLSFVNNLQSIIPVGGFSDDGPYIDLKPTGVTAGFNISVPNVEVGICMISNISLGAKVTLPFTGAPLTIGFNFCQRENPFLLTISCFGGGGYFIMVTTLKGIQSIEAAFEFGAAMSLNVGVASGGVSAMGGFYYKMELVEGEETTTLSGYLRLNGHLSILGLISLSLEFYLAFNAVLANGKVQKLEGVATLKVKVEIAFFSKTVSVTVRRELKGADADPKFVEMIDQNDWQEYCLAFAS